MKCLANQNIELLMVLNTKLGGITVFIINLQGTINVCTFLHRHPSNCQ